jgi:hypothetical protein
MIAMLGGSGDSLGPASGPARGVDASGSKPVGRLEQGAAQVLHEAEPGGSHGQPAPAAGGAVQDGPHDADAAGLAGEAAACSSEGWRRLNRLGPVTCEFCCGGMVAHMTTRSVLAEMTCAARKQIRGAEMRRLVRFAGCHGISPTGRDCGVAASSLPGYANTEVWE